MPRLHLQPLGFASRGVRPCPLALNVRQLLREAHDLLCFLAIPVVDELLCLCPVKVAQESLASKFDPLARHNLAFHDGLGIDVGAMAVRELVGVGYHVLVFCEWVDDLLCLGGDGYRSPTRGGREAELLREHIAKATVLGDD